MSSGTIKDFVKPHILDHGFIGMIWAHINGKVEDNDAIGHYREQIALAVINEQLQVSKISIKNKHTGSLDTEPNSPTVLNEASISWQLDKESVLFYIYKDDFSEWLEKTGQWPLADGCELIQWFGTEKHSNKKMPTKKRKYLIPLQRETNTSLELLYEIFTQYNVSYLDELSAQKSWGKIISGEFSSDLILGICETKKSITLSDGDKLPKNDFLEKYRKRFKYK